MAEIFTTSGEDSNNVTVPRPILQGLLIPSIDDPQAVDGFGIVTPWGGGSTTRKYGDYGISQEISSQQTQLNDLSNAFIPAEGQGFGAVYNIEGLIGPQGIPGRDGTTLVIHEGFGLNSNYLTELPHNLEEINALSTAADRMLYTTDSIAFITDIDWTETQPTGDRNGSWPHVAIDSDGSNIIVAETNGRVWLSTDTGQSWAETQPSGNSSYAWKGVASDSDGSHLMAGIYNGRLYTSANSGSSWTERQPAGAVDVIWNAVACDSDGSFMIAGVQGGRLYTSDDSGATWTERQPAGASDKQWFVVACDSDGSHLVAGEYGGRLYTSADSGATWTERKPAGDIDYNWSDVDSDSDGSNLIACGENARLYTSADSGVNWTLRTPLGNEVQRWRGVASNDDGSYLMALKYGTGGFVAVSSDSGVNWRYFSPSADTFTWDAAAVNSDGTFFIACASRIYISGSIETTPVATWAETPLTAFARTLLDDEDAPTAATTLGLGTGDSVEFTGLKTTGGRIVKVSRITGNTTLDTTHHHVFADTDGGTFTVNLPAGVAGTEYRIVNTGSSGINLTIAPNGAELLLGVNSNFTLFDGEALTIVYEATEGWF